MSISYGLVEKESVGYSTAEFGCVVDSAVTVVIVADGAVQQMIAEHTVKGFPLRITRRCKFVTTLIPDETGVAHARTNCRLNCVQCHKSSAQAGIKLFGLYH